MSHPECTNPLCEGECGECVARFAADRAILDATRLDYVRGPLKDAMKELRQLRMFLEREGYRRCDIASCNCGSFHKVR